MCCCRSPSSIGGSVGGSQTSKSRRCGIPPGSASAGCRRKPSETPARRAETSWLHTRPLTQPLGSCRTSIAEGQPMLSLVRLKAGARARSNVRKGTASRGSRRRRGLATPNRHGFFPSPESPSMNRVRQARGDDAQRIDNALNIAWRMIVSGSELRAAIADVRETPAVPRYVGVKC